MWVGGEQRWVAVWAAAAMLAALLLVPTIGSSATAPSPRVGDPDPVRGLVVGDSISQGSAGDWTWRYRLAKHLQTVGVDADLVGTWDSLYDVVHGTWGSEGYLDPDFDRDHAVVWGGSYRDVGASIGDLVAETRPHVVIDGSRHQ